MEFDNFDTEITCEEFYGDEEVYEQDDEFDEYDEPDCDDSDDGYALASAGWGTDEDYGGGFDDY